MKPNLLGSEILLMIKQAEELIYVILQVDNAANLLNRVLTNF